jgi:hypothetical protein
MADLLNAREGEREKSFFFSAFLSEEEIERSLEII